MSIPLIIAVNHLPMDVVKKLLNQGANINIIDNYGITALMNASYWGRSYVVRLLLNRGTDINIVDIYGQTALMFAARYGRSHVVRLLLNRGADINIINKHGQSALMCAYKRGNSKIVKVLKEHIEDEKRRMDYEIILANEKYIFIKKIRGLSFGYYMIGL